MFSKIIIANRGEIAVRIIRTCREMGIKTVAVYSDADINSLHVKLADETYNIGGNEAVQSYLDARKILDVAEKSQAEALHPGYGFLAENPEFAEMCEKRGVVFIGPTSACMKKVKPKNAARQLMRRINVPVVPGFDETLVNGTLARFSRVQDVVENVGYPVIIKPAGGGGGIGMMVARNSDELRHAVESVEERGRKFFGIPSFYVEKLLTNIKHIEFQIIADKYGNIVHLGDRECSIQRRFQKLLEEAPCDSLSPYIRMKMAVAALDIAMALQYVNAMTVEFFYFPETQEFYFNEVNTRLQVEHCVTEVSTGIDIVREQIRVAAGESLSFTQNDITIQAHAIECRITAEDAARGFLPSPGKITALTLPHGPGLRIDEGIEEGSILPIYYDPLLLKLITWGKTRTEAIARMSRALNEMKIEGVKTIIPLHQLILQEESFKAGYHTTNFLEKQNMVQKLRERQKKN